MAQGRAGAFVRAGHRTVVAVLASAGLAIGAAACGSPGTPASTGTSPTAGPLATLTAAQIAAKAVDSLKAASAVQVAGSLSVSGQQIRLRLTLARGKGCHGRMTLRGKGSFEIVMIRKSVWLKPDNAFWKSSGGSGGALSILSGKYVKLSKHSSLASLTELCSARQLASSFGGMKGVVKGRHATIAGQPVLQLKGTGTNTSDAMYVSNSATPQILRITEAGSAAGHLNFTGYGHAVKFRAPRRSQVLRNVQA